MFRLIHLLIVFNFFFQHTYSQDLYMPREVQKAYKKGTRSADGRVGKNYWQNHARYNITVSASPPVRTILGTEQITYTNNSPDTLTKLVFKLIVNIHKPGAARLRPAAEDYLTSGIHIDSFAINNQMQAWNESAYSNTIHSVLLNNPLASHDSVHLFVKWHYDVSKQSGREGMIDSTTYFLAYFYPRVSVYDDYEGWDTNEFNDALEFYNDFNDYTLNVQVSKNYLVWATGTLLNTDAVLQQPYASKLRQSMTSDDIIHIASKQDIALKKITVQNAVNTWQFKAGNVPDVALGFSDHYLWDATSVVVDPVSKRRASAQAAYNDTAADYHYVATFARHALAWLSANWPGIPYPYEKTTVFQGYAGMEYPMMANDESYGDTTFSRFVADHEIAHTYMPFYMGINEARYGFMDEGWATTFEYLLNRDIMGEKKAEEFFKAFRVSRWISDPSAGEDIPIITPGTSLNGVGLGNNEYGKPSLGYLAVLDMLGDATFKKCLNEYMNRWNGKHPIPWDFFNTFNDASGKNLNWFWSNWFFSNYYIDLAVKNAEKTKKGYSLSIDNIGGMAAPFNVIATYADGSAETFHKTAEVWKENQKRVNIEINTKKSIQSIHIDGGIFMDADETNNSWANKR